MKTQTTKHLDAILRALLLASAVLGMCDRSQAGTTTWTGAGTDQNWSTAGNWSTVGGSTPPAASDSVAFGIGAFPASTNIVGAVDNIVSASTTIASLSYVNTNGGANNFYHTTQLASGQTLTVNGSVFVGLDNSTTKVNMVGTGNFTVAGGATSVFGVGTAPVSPFKATSQTVTMVLADGNNTVTTSTNLICYSGSNNSKPAILSLGNGVNVLNANLFIIGSGKDRGTLNFASAGAGTLKMRAFDGVSRANLNLAIDGGGTASSKATVLLTGHTVDLLLNTVTNGAAVAGGNIKDSTLAFDTGMVDINNLIIAVKGGIGVAGLINNATNTVAGTGVLNVNNSLVMCRGTTTVAGTTNNAALNINGSAVAHIFCDIIRDPLSLGAVDTATIAMNGGTLDIQGHNIGASGLAIDNLILNGSSLSNLTAVSGSTIPVNVATLNLSGANLISVKTLPLVLTYPTTFHLIAYSSKTSSGTWSTPNLPGTFVGNISDSGSTIDVVITGGPVIPKAITWNGNPNGNWDTTTTNWIASGSTNYNQGDLVTFDDSLTGTSTVNLTTVLSPGTFTFNNNMANYVFTGSGSIGGNVAIIKNGTASLLLDNTGLNTFAGGLSINAGTVQAGNNDTGGSLGTGGVTNNGTLVFDHSDDITVSNALSGSGALQQIGTDTVTLRGSSSNFTGNISISSGTLKAGTTNSLGSWFSGTVTITNGGTLDIGGLPSANVTVFGPKQFMVSGAGVGGNGAIINNGPNSQQDAFQQITMTGNTTIGGTNRWDLRNGSPVLNQNGFTLTKTGPSETSLVSPTINTLGNIIINQGILSFEVAPVFNGGSGTITVNAAGTLGQYKMNAGAFTVPITLNGGAIQNLAASGGLGVNDSAITLTANSTLIGATIVTNSLTLNGVISESGGSHGLTKTGASSFILTANETYSGNTIINQGPLVLTGSGAIAGSKVITLQSNAVLDVSGVSSAWALGSSQTLSGTGAVNGMATVNGTVEPGTANSTGTLTFSNLVTLAGTNLMKLNPAGSANDQIISPNGITYGGTLIVSNLGGTITNGQVFQLFSASAYNANFTTVVLPVATGLSWTNNLTVDGTLTAGVVAGPAQQPYLTGISLSGSSLIITGTNGTAGQTYNILTSTNLALPLGNWTVLPASTFSSGNFSITNTVDPSARQNYYLIRTP